MFRVVTYNIRYGGTGRLDALVSVLKSLAADAIMLTEASDDEVLHQIAQHLDMKYVTAEGANHLACLSCVPIVEWKSHHPKGIRRSVLEVCLAATPQQEIRLYGIHLQCHYFSWNERQRLRELNAYVQYIKSQPLAPHLLLGDFNAVAPEARFATDRLPLKEKMMLWWEGGRVYRNAIQRLRDDGYTDCFRALHPDADGFTLPTRAPQVRLDYMFADPLLVESLQACIVVTGPEETTIASDHYPLLAMFDL